MHRSPEVSESIMVTASAERVYEAVANVRELARWSPECFAVWIWRRKGGYPNRFIGWNRRGAFVWFTSCQVRVALAPDEFAFDVTSLGLPVARWGYRCTPTVDGTLVTEYWQDRRNRASMLLGRVFTGPAARTRPQTNRDGMRETLARLKQALDSA